MKLKDKVKVGEYVKLYSHYGSMGYFSTPNHEGVIIKMKGLNAYAYELTFDDNSVGYLTLTTKVER